MSDSAEKDLKDLLWCIGNQTEKVNSRLTVIMEKYYSEYSEEQKYEIKKRIMDNIGRRYE